MLDLNENEETVDIYLMYTHQSSVLGSHTGSLHQQLLVSELHAIQSCNSLQKHQSLSVQFRRSDGEFSLSRSST